MSSDKGRLSRYGKAIWETSRADEGTISFIGANIVARAVMAAADVEMAELRAEVDRLKRDVAGQTRSAQNGWRNCEKARDELADLRHKVDGFGLEWIYEAQP